MEMTVQKLNGIVIDGKFLWAILDKDGHTIIQMLQLKEPTDLEIKKLI